MPETLMEEAPATTAPPRSGAPRPAGAAGGLLAQPWAIALAVAIPLALAYLIVEPPSGDLAAATYRSELFARTGLALWDNGWYGGHYLPGYSLLAPALGALVGNRVLLALSTIVSAGLFGLIAQRTFTVGGARIAAGSFALGACVGLLSGRVAYDLGLAVGLLAVVLLQRGHSSAAVALAALTSLASPVAGAFLALAGVAYAVAGRTRRGLAIAAAALLPIVLLALAFPEGGWEPFAPSVFWPGLGGVLLIALLLGRFAGGLTPRAMRVLTWGALLYAVALIGAYALHTPVGSNAARLGALLGAPLVAGALWERRPLVLLALAPVLLYWQLETPINDVSELVGDPSVNASFYAPLLGELEGRSGGGPVRVEVPMTGTHWESVYLPGHGSILLARGWERQLDTRYGALFYEGQRPIEDQPPLTAATYRRWLYENAVSYVALPDVRLDFAGAAEGQLIVRGLPYLHEVWRSAHWRLYAVRGAPALAQPPARLASVGADSFTLVAPRPGSYVVRVRFTPYWALEDGHGCVRHTAGGWTAVEAHGTGTIRVGIDFSLARVFDHGPRCA
ncbi:MAG TPA: hypothetical protein VNY52_08395 [Solirubrobacteraceae bacterium]|jgi:hypothetical protein|nr:hypothetical protein [Solirubrobacteraceae bacterium]